MKQRRTRQEISALLLLLCLLTALLPVRVGAEGTQAGAASLPMELTVHAPTPSASPVAVLDHGDHVYTAVPDVSDAAYLSARDTAYLVTLDCAYLVTADVVLTEDIRLSNYDAQITWPRDFALLSAENLQQSALTMFQANLQTGQLGAGASQDAALSAGAPMLRCTFVTPQRLAPGEYPFTLTVTNAAREDQSVPDWSGGAVTAALRIDGLTEASIRNYAPEEAGITLEPERWSFTVASPRPCTVLYYNGSAYQRLFPSLDWRGGAYRFTLPGDWDSSREIVVALTCDYTLNGVINSTDAAQVLRTSARLREATEVERLVADINGDGRLNSTDALQILRLAVGLRTVSWW